ncbi:MAG: aromatic ring-hydroxylating dioxygenase subunit alpha [Gammaproteobacteria bacterium]
MKREYADPDSGTARSEGPDYGYLLDHDSRTPPHSLQEEQYRYLGSDPIPADHYLSEEFFRLEVERMWPRVWQMACREEDVMHPGDTLVYENVGRSVIILRDNHGALRAYWNSCLHRGRKLVTEKCNVKNLRCPFHGFTWTLEGTISSVPCRWDFAHLEDNDLILPEVRLDTWGGFVFINWDGNAPPLQDYLEVLPEHFRRWEPENCFKHAHVARRINANWKIAMEAFMESYHVLATHPQILPFAADANSRYDIYGDHVNRNLMAFGVTSPHLSGKGIGAGDIWEGMLAMWGRESTRPGMLDDNEPLTARQALGELNRKTFSRAFKRDHDASTDAEVLDAMVYNVFPNFSPWAGFAPNIIYRWRPDGMNVNSCIMEVMLLKRVPEGEPRPDPAPVRRLQDDEPWSNAKELPILGPVIDQDMNNLPHMQTGLRSSASGMVHLANYQEIRIRHFHRTLEKYINGEL